MSDMNVEQFPIVEPSSRPLKPWEVGAYGVRIWRPVTDTDPVSHAITELQDEFGEKAVRPLTAFDPYLSVLSRVATARAFMDMGVEGSAGVKEIAEALGRAFPPEARAAHACRSRRFSITNALDDSGNHMITVDVNHDELLAQQLKLAMSTINSTVGKNYQWKKTGAWIPAGLLTDAALKNDIRNFVAPSVIDVKLGDLAIQRRTRRW